MRTLLLKYISASLLLCLFAACIKEPRPGFPLPNKPVWLLTKTIHRVNSGKPEWGPMTRYKIVHEYKYNQHNKPWLHIYYQNVADSNNLLPTEIDTLYYDQWNRVKQVSHYVVLLNWTMSLKKYTYKGKDKLPATEEVYSKYDPYGNGPFPQPVFIWSSQFIYQDTVVYQIRERTDSIRFSYDAAGNHTRTAVYRGHLGAYEWDDLFTSFNSAPNPDRFFNLDHGLIFRTDNSQFGLSSLPPILSKHTWTTYYSNRSDLNPGPYVVRSIVLNENGLVAQTISPYRDYSYNPPYDETITYEYTKVK